MPKLHHALCGAGLVVLIVLLDPMLSTGQPGGGFGQPGGGRGQPGGGFGQPGGGFGQPGGGFGQPGGGRGGRGSKGGFGGGKGGFGGDTGGGRRGRGGRTADPERDFAMWSMGGPTIDMTRMDANMKSTVKRYFQSKGMATPGDTSIITKAQFVESFSRAQASQGPPGMGFGGPGGPPGGFGRGGFPPQGGGRQFTVNFKQGSGSRGFGGPNFGPGPGGFGDRNNPGGERDRSFRMTDEDIEKKFAEYDANKDGKLSEDELPDRSPLRANFKDSDTSKDGYIDLVEYKAYVASSLGGGSDGTYGSYGGNGNYGRKGGKDDKPAPPVAIRYGKLPEGLPSFWSLDTDKDGQIGLYEWRADGRDIAEFQKMDLDKDGLLAPHEWQRFNVKSAEDAKAFALTNDIDVASEAPKSSGRGAFPGSFPGGNRNGFGSGSGAPGGRGNYSKGGRSGRGFDKSSNSKGGRGGSNPWSGGGR